MFGKGAISGFHLIPNLSSNARLSYSFRRCSYSFISVSLHPRICQGKVVILVRSC